MTGTTGAEAAGILVEAKANRPELRTGPKKPFRLSQEQVQRMSVPEQEISKRRSADNDLTIDAALSAATKALRNDFPTISLSPRATTSYQIESRSHGRWRSSGFR